ncbi:MAG: sensor histidine kinase [Verrucomicrobiae bacterium]|nr:sensor histidine kinase [Verrucomicrobiae bacterium]MCX7915264.1 sensor histidine kinase [Verrucomicrobiae bacterium]MDW8342925.1 sensor histidine kinase [Verrucomicrobiae bacterium]
MLEELSLHILDIGMNSLAAGATVLSIEVLESARRNWLIIRVRDNGRGMDAATLRRVLEQRRSSTKSKRRKGIGLGLALLRQTAEMCGGRFHIRSAPGQGTTVVASMRLNHVDRPPLGNLDDTVLALCAANPDVEIRLRYRTDSTTFQFSSKEREHHEPRTTQTSQREGTAAGCVA